MYPDQSQVPVLFLIFNRPETTQEVFGEIAKVKPRQLFVAADGPRCNREGEAEKCQQTRDIINRIDWSCELKTLFRDENLGCKAAVSSAIGWFFEHVEEGIILEDDCLPSGSFFAFCSQLLERYRHDERVMMISGNNFQDDVQIGSASYYFSRNYHIWGWATWRRAWSLHQDEISSYTPDQISSEMRAIFPDENISLAWVHAFCQNIVGETDTWDYPWFYSCLINNGLSINPNYNLVTNIGFGDDSTHTVDFKSKMANRKVHEIDKIDHPDKVICDHQADMYEYRNFYPLKEDINIVYRYRRYRKSRRLKKKIKKITDLIKISGFFNSFCL